MVVVRLKGGLGNQMFQYAAGLTFAHNHKSLLYIDRTFLDFYVLEGQFTKRSYALNCFQLEQIFWPINLKYFKFSKRKWWYKVLLKVNLIMINATVVDEFLFFDNYHTKSKIYYLDGYFQNEKYFEDYRQELIKSFELRNELSDNSKKYMREIDEKRNYVSLHVRRGDYLYANNMKIQGIIDLMYYKRAIEHLVKTCGENLSLMVFSDDTDWVMKNIQFSVESVCVVSGNESRPEEDLFLMSKCKHNIIANSTFSWWGAWLNIYKEKIVIAPKHWYIDLYSCINESIIPEGWIRIEN